MGKFIDSIFDEKGKIDEKKLQEDYLIAIENGDAELTLGLYNKSKILPDYEALEKIKFMISKDKTFGRIYSLFNQLNNN